MKHGTIFVHVRNQWVAIWSNYPERWCPSIHKNYFTGKLPPRYPMPATLDNADVATNWTILSACPHKPGPCRACVDNWMDGLL